MSAPHTVQDSGAKQALNGFVTAILQERAEIISGPADDLEVADVGLPYFFDRRRFIRKLLGSVGDQIIRCGD